MQSIIEYVWVSTPSCQTQARQAVLQPKMYLIGLLVRQPAFDAFMNHVNVAARWYSFGVKPC